MMGFAAVSIKAFDQQAKAEAGLRTALGQNEAAFKSLTEQAKELQKVTLFGDEETIAAQTMLATMGLEEEAIKRLIPLVQDMATAKGMNLKAAADLVAKSVGSSTNALSRYGITIEGAVGSTERLDSAVGSLATMFSGQATAAAEAGAGAWTQLKNELMDFAEVVGGSLLPLLDPLKDKIQEFTNQLSNLTTEQVTAKVKTALLVAAIGPLLLILSNLASAFQVVLGVIPKVISALRLLAIAVASNPLGALATALALVAGYMMTFGTSTNKAKNDLDNFNKTGSTTAERLKEINDQLERSTKTELELIKEEAAARQKEIFEEMGNLTHLAKDRLEELQKEYNSWGDVIKKATKQQKEQAAALDKVNKSLRTKKEKTTALTIAEGQLAIQLAALRSEHTELTAQMEADSAAAAAWGDRWKGLGDTIANDVAGAFTTAVTAGGNMAQNLGEAFRSLLRQMAQMVIKAAILAAIITTISGGAGAASFGSVFQSQLTGVAIPKMATGGNVLSGQPYLVGEHGPELFSPSGSSGGHISSASQTAQMGIPDVRISGEDLIIVFDRAKRHRNSLG
jgi:hypothetical protein